MSSEIKRERSVKKNAKEKKNLVKKRERSVIVNEMIAPKRERKIKNAELGIVKREKKLKTSKKIITTTKSRVNHLGKRRTSEAADLLRLVVVFHQDINMAQRALSVRDTLMCACGIDV